MGWTIRQCASEGCTVKGILFSRYVPKAPRVGETKSFVLDKKRPKIHNSGKIWQYRQELHWMLCGEMCTLYCMKTTGAGAWSKRSYCHVDSSTFKQHTEPQKSGRTWAWCCQVLVTFDPLAEGLELVPARQLSTGSRTNTKFEHAQGCGYAIQSETWNYTLWANRDKHFTVHKSV